MKEEPKVSLPSKAGDPRLPTSWARYSYKALSVGAPAGWRISPYVPFCSWPANTVAEFTLDNAEQLASACAAMPSVPSVRDSVAIECLTGTAGRVFSGGSRVTFSHWKLIRQASSSSVYLQGDGWQAAVVVAPTVPPAVATRILATVEPTGRPC